eukprot:GFUD01018670.1.p1 GENE.GFUD01018670.1~~GFUD01018670.1.p1  ORF type:complete len:675 (-),score=216.95 GFUD01018670.1:180-2204(-)
MASQSASQSDVDDQRFAELLKPIKDLTQNWEVPLANLLSTYIDDLQHVTITFDGGETSVNFAEAALLLQGTASVYSKKVEFLWQLVLQTLDMLRSKKLGEDGGEVGKGGKKKQHVDMTTQFELLVVELGSRIDLKDEEESLDERKQALKFIYVTPSQLIEKEGSEQKPMKVNLYTQVAEAKWDLLAGKEDFRINSQYVSQTGGLADDLNVDNMYVNLEQDYSIPLQPPSPDNHGDDIDEDVAEHGDQDLSHVSVIAPAQSISSPAGECLAPVLSSASPSAPASPVNTTPVPEFDPWAPLDPHEQVCTPKSMKKGRTTRLPPSLANKRKIASPLPPISEYLMEEMSASFYNPAMLPDVAPVFYPLAAQEMVRRRKREKELRLEKFADRPELRRDVFGNDDDQDFPEQFDDDRPEKDGDDSPDRFFEFDFPDPHAGGEIGAAVVGDLQIDDDTAGVTDSYEVLVARRVAEFVSKSQEFMNSTVLARKVGKWHDMMGPRLDKVEKRKAFDIHAYGSQILDSFHSDKYPRGKAIPFDEVVRARGLKGEEVARYFLSTLMLANSRNIKISTAAGSDPQLGMDNVTLSLLSTTRHHLQLAEFQALRQGIESDSGIGESPGGSETGNSTTSAGSGHLDQVANKKKKSSKETDPVEDVGDGDRNVEEFRVPEPPRSKERSRN